MLLADCYVALLLTGCVAVLGVETARIKHAVKSPEQSHSEENLPLAFSSLTLSKDKAVEQIEAWRRERDSIFEELGKYGVQDMTAPDISETERTRRTEEYYKHCTRVPMEMLRWIVLSADEKAKAAFINTRTMIEFAKDRRRRREINETFGGISWSHLARICPNIVIPQKGFYGLPKKAVLAFMNNNNPWEDCAGCHPVPEVNWPELLAVSIEDDYPEMWKWITPSTIAAIHKATKDHPRKDAGDSIELGHRLVAIIAKSSSKNRGLKRIIEQAVRVMYLERATISTCLSVDLEAVLRSALGDLEELVSSSKAGATGSTEKSIARLRNIVYRPPSEIPRSAAPKIYNQDALKLPIEDSTLSAIEADFEVWSAHVDSEYPGNQHYKILLLMRHLEVLPDRVLHRQLSNITNNGQTPLPLCFIDELAENLEFHEYKLTLELLRDCVYELSKTTPLLVVEYSLRWAQQIPEFSGLVLAGVPIAHIKQAVTNQTPNKARL